MVKRAIIADSSLDLNEELKSLHDVKFVPFKIEFEDREFIDTQDGDTLELMEYMHKTSNIASTACPSPGEYIEALEERMDVDEIFILTLSKKLSGSFNSAVVASEMFMKEHKEKKVHVIDTLIASAGSVVIYLKLLELIKEDIEFEEIVDRIEKYVAKTKGFCTTEDFSQFIKSGRMSKVAGNFAQAINIMPIISTDENGDIVVEKITRGKKGLLRGMVETVDKYTSDTTDTNLVISHNNAPEKAQAILEKITEKHQFKNIYIVPMHMIISTYVHYRGVIVGIETD